MFANQAEGRATVFAEALAQPLLTTLLSSHWPELGPMQWREARKVTSLLKCFATSIGNKTGALITKGKMKTGKQLAVATPSGKTVLTT